MSLQKLRDGFTLLEILWVVLIIGGLVAVILPMAMRVGADAKVAMVRQAASELSRWGMEWGERTLEAQDVQDTCVLNDYIATLTCNGAAGYVDNIGNNNWVDDGGSPAQPGCRTSGPMTFFVSDIVDQDKQPRNPFDGSSYFNANGANNGTLLKEGLLYLATTQLPDTAWHYYFVFSGPDSNATGQWHAGMGDGENPGLNYNNMRNGIFMARLLP
jgi:prepilin-type N-terminal cleavage/methylation domain-containing protein